MNIPQELLDISKTLHKRNFSLINILFQYFLKSLRYYSANLQIPGLLIGDLWSFWTMFLIHCFSLISFNIHLVMIFFSEDIKVLARDIVLFYTVWDLMNFMNCFCLVWFWGYTQQCSGLTPRNTFWKWSEIPMGSWGSNWGQPLAQQMPIHSTNDPITEIMNV